MGSSRWKMVMAAGVCVVLLTGCTHEPAISPSTTKQHAKPTDNRSNQAPTVNPTVTSKPIPAGVANTQQLAYQLRDELLKQMSDPAQGQVCLDNACSVAVTSFTGPSSQDPKETLTMAYYQMKNGWYVLVAPTRGNALAVAQQIAKARFAFPNPSGVLVVSDGEMEWHWLTQGHEWTKRQSFVSR
ncbi:hypothetical protein C7445_104220 [Alicyclobacillus sacchari]|uniref:Lipoprotein n=1 Tax=Alicyclobacillus sacchari TaxID=392010 RepID=A0A4R8LSL9_9BACL|nr:hypothetical protein [Alicyclobacillus sacchari]TDY49707.1 hypothetical protein C7445_104220 [Alicyclobacillus sacchari]GMA58375.1 hypothetical protein GCM10025858_28780 [Alicyclobacillus sacchari]